ncbi:unnamed protein product [Rotaria magnacalcarata]|uniref:Uncharacterized protein n=1 Tax=Rotaria magnacalcarata TaxID=392030 RepID=A0A816UNY9_9BILA|nr:unnamed protein product [Rotaria magnacalcarata]
MSSKSSRHERIFSTNGQVLEERKQNLSGDYVVKILMGAIDNWFDERRVTGNAPPDRHGTKGKKKGACCIL